MDETSTSALIPFCSFGDDADRVGKRLNNFRVPVCNLFREKIVSGQVCYEANINQFKHQLNWVEAVNKGFGFIVDTNDEYDVRAVSLKSQETNKETKKTFDIYKYSKTDKTFHIFLKTISK